MNGEAKWVQVGWLAVALVPVLAGLAGARTQVQQYQPIGQEDEQQQIETIEPTTEFHAKLEKANELIGAKVVNKNKEKLGAIEEIVLTPNREAVSYAVLSSGGILGFGSKYFAVPWPQFQVGTEKTTLVLNVSKADLDKAQGFDKKRWPTTANENWLGVAPVRAEPSVRMEAERPATHEQPAPAPGTPGYQAPAAAEPRRESPPIAEPRARTEVPPVATDIKYRKLSELIGITVENPQSVELGELENAMVDVHEGKLAYGILSIRSGFLGLNKDFVAVPWTALDVAGQRGIALLDASKETLAAIAFDEDHFPNLEDMQYSRDIHTRFHATPYWEALGFVPGEEKEPLPATPPSRIETPRAPHMGAAEYEALYKVDAVKTFQGTIESVGTFRLPGTSVEGLRLRLRTDDGKLVTVHTGPRSFLDRQDISFHHGDKVTITGAPAKVDWREVVLAAQIKAGDKTIDLRNQEGKPLWNVEELKGLHEPKRSHESMDSHEHESDYEYETDR